MSDSEFDNITPADLNLSGNKQSPDEVPSPEAPSLGIKEIQRSDEEKKKHTFILAGIFMLLLVLVGGVVFVLPQFIAPPGPATTTSSVVVVSPRTDTAAAVNEISPFDEAQKLRQREEAQNVLAKLLELQETLEDMEVQTWAEEEFSQVFELAGSGDAAYREQGFTTAESFYLQGLNILLTLEAGLPDVFARYMTAGEQAILEGDVGLAEESFNIAVLINPGSDEAVTGYDRSQILAQVLALVSEGADFHEALEFEDASEKYGQALAMDSAHVGAQSLLRQARQDILARDFSVAMSRGFNSLAAGNPEQAESAFRDALVLKPQAPEALSALEQTISQMTLAAITVHLDAAEEFASQERWQQALVEFDAALAIDPNLVTVREDRSEANSRNNLDRYLESINTDPLRLAENAVHQQAVGIYNDAVNISGNWPRLDGQLVSLRNFLERATEPVAVRLTSDGITNVTVFQVGNLGQFTNHTLDLTPGSYVAVGVRDGFRDVREEFVIGFDGQSPVITVQCVEEVL
jgi:tetratricopeptide (TPR) repeat protein